MSKKIEILGVPVHPGTLSRSREKVLSFLDAGIGSRSIYSINPEIIMAARKNGKLMKILKEGALNLPDGMGVVWAGRLLNHYVPERVAGYDLVCSLLPFCGQRGYRVFLLGGEPGVADEAGEKIKKEYPGLDISGTYHGYFSVEEEDEVCARIKKAKPDLLLVGMGYPRQEQFIHRNCSRIKVPVSMAVGGTIDVLAGRARRAPAWIRKIGLEWLYRIVTLRRWNRFFSLPCFGLLILKEKWRGGIGDA